MFRRRASGRRWLGGVLAISSTLASAGSARAAFELPEGCGSELEFTAEVQRRLGSEVAPLPTSLKISPYERGYVLWLQVGSEQRVLRDPGCRELFHAAVVVAATIALSEARRASSAEAGSSGAAPAAEGATSEATPTTNAAPEKAPPPSPPSKRSQARSQPAAAAAPARPSEVVAAPDPRARDTNPSGVGLSFALAAGVFGGVTPALAPRFDLEARLTIADFGLVAGGGWFPPSADTDAAGRGVEVRGFRGALAGVWLPVELIEARLGASAYRLTGTGVGSFGHRSDGAWSSGLVAGILVAPLRRGRLWAGVALEGEWLLVRSRFEILNYREVFRVSPVTGAGLLKLGVHAF